MSDHVERAQARIGLITDLFCTATDYDIDLGDLGKLLARDRKLLELGLGICDGSIPDEDGSEPCHPDEAMISK